MSELNFPNNPVDRELHRDDANHVLYENSNAWGTPVFTGPTMGPATGGLPIYLLGDGVRFDGGNILGDGGTIDRYKILIDNSYPGD